jgi:hypothetical protein
MKPTIDLARACSAALFGGRAPGWVVEDYAQGLLEEFLEANLQLPPPQYFREHRDVIRQIAEAIDASSN